MESEAGLDLFRGRLFSGRFGDSRKPSSLREEFDVSCWPNYPGSTLRSHKPIATLCAENVVMEIGDPLPARNRQVQIFYAVVEMH